jgi:hypothetical protein
LPGFFMPKKGKKAKKGTGYFFLKKLPVPFFYLSKKKVSLHAKRGNLIKLKLSIMK